MPHRLLLADDSVTIQRVIELTFSGQDVDVIAVGDGEQAIARIQSDRPDIVLADIGMPKRSGYDVAAFVKNHAELRHIPVLLLAGAFEPVDDARAAAVGCDGVLVKPFEPQQVIARVKELLGGTAGAPTQAIPDIARPVERLTPREPPSVPTIDRDFVPPPERGPDESLEAYFNRLDAAFSSLKPGSAPSPPIETPDESDIDDRGFDDRIEVPTLDDLLSSDVPPGAPASPIDMPATPPASSVPPLRVVPPPTVEPPDSSPTLAPGVGSVPSHDTTQPLESPHHRGLTPESPHHRGLTPEQTADATSAVADAFSALLAVEQGEPGARPVRFSVSPTEPIITNAFLDEVARRVLERLGPDVARALVAEIVSDVAERLVKEEIERIRKKM
jgi:CheY-like chemotaxis protein